MFAFLGIRNDLGIRSVHGLRMQNRISDLFITIERVFRISADKAPAVFTFLGIRNESAGSVHGLHTPHFTMDESQLPVGILLHY